MSRLIEIDSPFLSNLNISESDVDRVTALIEAASVGIERYCGRKFAKAEYVEIAESDSVGMFWAKNPPFIKIKRVCQGWSTVCDIKGNTRLSTVSVSETGLTLTVFDDGVSEESELLFADYPTLADLIAALPEPFFGVIATGFEIYPSADLVAGYYNSSTFAGNLGYWVDISGKASMRWGSLECIPRNCPIRVKYVGGFDPIPEDLQKVCAALVADQFDRAKSDAVISESLGSYSYSIDPMAVSKLPISNKQILESYRIRI